MASIPHYLRLKPSAEVPGANTQECLIESQTEHQIKFKETTSFNKFTKIFSDVSQVDLYKETLQDLTFELLEHDKDSVFFTLGPSNSGKSYSIYGDDSNPGISIYALNEIFQKIGDNFADFKIFKRHFGDSFLVSSNANKNSNKGEFGLSISVFEIYNDRIRDLSLDSSKTANQSLDIITDAKDGKTKPNRIRQIYVANLAEAKLVLHKSIKRRAVSPTNLNDKSSRSHLFIYFNLHKVTGRKIVRTSRLTISDLAGSERTKTAKTEGKEFKEGNYTNQSLTELGRCLSMMKSKKFDRSNLRTSKLTRLLLTDLFGNFTQNRIKILLTLDPYSNLGTILHAIRYIQPVAKVTITSERNSLETSDNIHLSQLSEEIKLLRTMNQALETEKRISEEKLLELEVNLRKELNEEYENRIKELEFNHLKSINELKASNQESIDEKLELLSQDYEEKIENLSKAHSEKLSELELSHNHLLNSLTTDYETKLSELSKNKEIDSTLHNELSSATNQLRELQHLVAQSEENLEQAESKLRELQDEKTKSEQMLKELEKSKAKSEQELISDITKERRENDDLKKKLEELAKNLKSIEQSEHTKSNQIQELSSELERMKNKRKSDTFINEPVPASNKRTKVEEPNFDDKENELSSMSPIKILATEDPTTLSPIKIKSPTRNPRFDIQVTSPSKHKATFQSPFKLRLSPSKSPIKVKSPSKKVSFESPSKVLREINFDHTLPSPKIKVKSPAKKKKLNKREISEESF